MDAKLLEILVCPVTKTPLVHKAELSELWCVASRLAYPIKDDVPVMLESEARELTQDELDSLT